MHAEIEALASATNDAAELLRSVGEQHWSAWLAQNSRLLLNSDFRGIEGLRSAFGGMGSLNDLIIHPINGHNIQESEAESANRRLQELLSEISRGATKLYYEELEANRRT